MNEYTLESFATGQRQTVHASDWTTALDTTTGDNFVIVQMPDGRFMAGHDENSVLPVAGGHWADTPEAAAVSLKEHYSAILAASDHQDTASKY